jgi:hypothetical protein
MRPWESVPAPSAAGRDRGGRTVRASRMALRRRARGPGAALGAPAPSPPHPTMGRPHGARELPGRDGARTGASAPAARPEQLDERLAIALDDELVVAQGDPIEQIANPLPDVYGGHFLAHALHPLRPYWLLDLAGTGFRTCLIR